MYLNPERQEFYEELMVPEFLEMFLVPMPPSMALLMMVLLPLVLALILMPVVLFSITLELLSFFLVYKLLPEECVAELEALYKQLKSQKKPRWLIVIIIIWNFLELIFAVYIQIKIENLLLSIQKKKK